LKPCLRKTDGPRWGGFRKDFKPATSPMGKPLTCLTVGGGLSVLVLVVVTLLLSLEILNQFFA
jgi:hypothetical protein